MLFYESACALLTSHSTVSRSLSALEDELGVRLVERDNRVVGLTAAGERLCERAGELVRLADEIDEEMRNM